MIKLLKLSIYALHILNLQIHLVISCTKSINEIDNFIMLHRKLVRYKYVYISNKLYSSLGYLFNPKKIVEVRNKNSIGNEDKNVSFFWSSVYIRKQLFNFSPLYIPNHPPILHQFLTFHNLSWHISPYSVSINNHPSTIQIVLEYL